MSDKGNRRPRSTMGRLVRDKSTRIIGGMILALWCVSACTALTGVTNSKKRGFYRASAEEMETVWFLPVLLTTVWSPFLVWRLWTLRKQSAGSPRIAGGRDRGGRDPLTAKSSLIPVGLVVCGLGLLLAGMTGINAVKGHQDNSLALGCLAAVTLAIAGLLLIAGSWKGRRERRIALAGRLGTATVTGVRESSFQPSDDGGPLCAIRYSYQDHLGQAHNGTSPLLPTGEASRWRVGDQGRIRFDETNSARSAWLGERVGVEGRAKRAGEPDSRAPSLFALIKRAPSVGLSLLLFLGAYLQTLTVAGKEDWWSRNLRYFFLLAGALLLCAGLRKVRIWWSIARTGVPTDGTVTARKETGAGGVWAWTVRYRYPDHQGKQHEGRSGYLPRLEVFGVSVGKPCTIKFALERPERSVWIGSM